MDEGSFLGENDDQMMRKVAVIGPQAASELFTDGSDPVGQTIRINGQTLIVIGITTSKGERVFESGFDCLRTAFLSQNSCLG